MLGFIIQANDNTNKQMIFTNNNSTLPGNFLTIPSEKLSIIMNLGPINDAQKLIHRELLGEKLLSRHISLERSR